MITLSYVLAMALFTAGAPTARADVIDGVTFASEPGVLYVPVRDVGQAFGWDVSWNAEAGTASLRGRTIEDGYRKLFDGLRLIPIRKLEDWGATITWAPEDMVATVSVENAELQVRRGEKRAVINKAEQEIRGWQGDRLIFKSRVSTGREGYNTPTGSFTAGPYKARMHYSSLYDNAPMPFSVQIVGNIFVHGYTTVPNAPASHGCIRLPLTGINLARWFYEWIDVGTPVEITGAWPN
jgi:hypothetical protein